MYDFHMVRRFADALDDALKAASWSLKHACEVAGVSYEQMKKMKQRGASTNVDDAIKLAHALGFTLDELVGDDTADLRSDIGDLWRKLSEAERRILIAAARGQGALGHEVET